MATDIIFPISAFISALFLLDLGADKFITHTAALAARLGISPTLIALLTAGAEWEELAVVIAAISEGRSSLALGNILGSSISNILGAFSLGLLFQAGEGGYDRSAKIYAAVMLGFTTVLVGLGFLGALGRVVGGCLVVGFGAYVGSVGWFIHKGVMKAPEESDSDDDCEGDRDSDSNSDDDDDEERASGHDDSFPGNESPLPEEATPLIDGSPSGTGPLPKPAREKKSRHSTIYHIVQLIFGFLALSLSGYILSHSISAIADAFSLSDTVLGLTVLAIATTLPEKLLAVYSSTRAQPGIMVANTAGSNIFLMTLCAGVLFLSGNVEELNKGLETFDLVATWLSAVILTVIVMLGGRRWMGVLLLVLYLGFIAAEFAFAARKKTDTP